MQKKVLTFVAAVVLAAARPAAAGYAGRTNVAVSPVQKVIQMLQGMLEKGKQEKNAEAVQFAAYKQFCTDTTQQKTQAVQLAEEQIQMLKANIQMATTSAENLQLEMQQLDNQMATWQGDLKAANQVRQKEQTDYSAAHKDYSETIDAIGRAVDIIKAKAKDAAQAPATAALAQLAAMPQVPEAAKRVVAAFLATDDLAGPEEQAAAYQSRSGGIIDMLLKLKEKFIDERTTLEKEEVNRRHAFELLAQDLQKSVANAEESRSSKMQQRAKHLQSVAEMQGTLADTTSTKADDAKYLSDMGATCSQKSVDFEERQRVRAQELEALQKAIDILSSNAVKGASEKHLELLQRGTAPVLLQLRSAGFNPNQQRAVAFLNERAGKIGSSVLSALALRAQEDPFAKVKKMLRDLIARLQDAAGEEAQHEQWCKTELTENEAVRTARSTDVERLSSEIDGKKSAIAKYSSEVSELNQELASNDKETQTLTQLRTDEKAKNLQTIKDAQEAQTAVEQAITVLKEFYAMAAQSTSLVQQRSSQAQEPPPVFEGAYTGMGAENGGVVAMLEVIQSDFARLESTTSAAEATSQQEYDRQMTESAILKVQTQKDIEHKNIMMQQDQQALVDLNNDLSSAQKELDAANAYYDKLKPSCVDSGMSFEERAKRRQEEIESLQEALRILNGEDIAMS